MSDGKPAARVGDQDTGHGPYGPTPINRGASSVTIGGKPAARIGDTLEPHHPGARVIMKGSGSVTIEGKPAARIGDPISCGGVIATGEGSVRIGDAAPTIAAGPLKLAFDEYVETLLDPTTTARSPDELQALQDQIAVKYEPRFPGDTVGQLKAAYQNQSIEPKGYYPQPNRPQATEVAPVKPAPRLASVDINVSDADGRPAAGFPYTVNAPGNTIRSGTLDAYGQAHIAQLQPGPVTVQVGGTADSSEIRHTRAALREALDQMLQAEIKEAQQISAELAEKNALEVTWEYKKAQMRGLWTGTVGLISSIKDLAELSQPLFKFQQAAKAAWQAWKYSDESPYLQAFGQAFSDIQFEELADVLGIDPRSITKAQLAEVSALINFIWDDPQTRSALLRFAKDYIAAQHNLELVETVYATAPEIAFDILITSLTMGAGASVAVATKARWVSKLSEIGEILTRLAKQLKKAKQKAGRSGQTGETIEMKVDRPDYQELEVPENAKTVTELPAPKTAAQLRTSAGRASGGLNLPEVTGKWLKGTDGNLGIIPGQIADALNGRQFNNFNQFKEAFWRATSSDPHLASQFSKVNVKRMSKGLAPIAKQSQHLGKQQSYILHHKTPIQHGGPVYNMNNIIVVTPRLHKEILDGSFHFGSK